MLKEATEQEARKIFEAPIYVLEDNNYVISRADAAKLIAGLEGYVRAEIYDLPSMELLTTTFGTFLDKTDPDFREEIIEELTGYQTQDPDTLSLVVPALDQYTFGELKSGRMRFSELSA